MVVEWIKIPSGGPIGSDYEIMKYPVTNAQYCEWLRNGREDHYCKLMEAHFFGGIKSDLTVKEGFEKKPVVFVNWFDAQEFGKSAGGRLPTAEEWRKAAAWLPQENRFAEWVTGLDKAPTQHDVIYYDYDNGWALPAPHLADVDWYRPSGAYGCCGMAGNVGEWVDAEMKNGWKYALGGSLFRPIDLLRLNSVEGDHPSKRLSTFGFRLVRKV